MVGPKIPLPWLKKDILSHARTYLTRAHHIIEQQKNSHDHGWFVFIGRQLSYRRHRHSLHLTHRDLSFCYHTIPQHSAIFSDPFLTQNGLTPPWVAMSPHIHNQQQFEVSLCLFYWFLSKMCSCVACLTPLLHLSCRICIICCSDSTWTIGCRTNPFCSCEATTASQMATCPSPQNAPKVLHALKIWQS